MGLGGNSGRRPRPRPNRTTDAETQGLREQCAPACLTHIQNVLTAYEGAPAALEHEGIDDRAVDLWSPVVAVTLVADAEDGGTHTRQLLDLAKALGTARDADAEAGTTARLLEALEAIQMDLARDPRRRPCSTHSMVGREGTGSRARAG